MSDLPLDPGSSYFSKSSHSSQLPGELRASAEALLKTGSSPSNLGYVLSPDALAVLYKLVSSSDGASDGLKLLHELQTHQIELDLQHQQSAITERETAELLARYKTLYDFAPVGYVIVSRSGHIIESNRASADLLAVSGNELNGCLFEQLLAADSRSLFNWKLKKLFSGAPSETCTVNTVAKTGQDAGGTTALRVFAALAPNSEVALVNISLSDNPPSA